jgi:hypothetical protein
MRDNHIEVAFLLVLMNANCSKCIECGDFQKKTLLQEIVNLAGHSFSA